MRGRRFCLALLCSVTLTVVAADESLYENNFEKAETGKVPEDFLVLEGGFAVREGDGNKFLELPGAPLETFGVLFGPTESSNMVVSARIFSTAKGRRYPTLAVGLNGVGGYRLQVSPAKKALELYKGDELKSSASYEWNPGQWTFLRLQLRNAKEGEWKVEGKAWTHGSKEPADWMISFDEKTAPPAGRASVWGSPYSGTPIQFDDLVVARVNVKPP